PAWAEPAEAPRKESPFKAREAKAPASPPSPPPSAAPSASPPAKPAPAAAPAAAKSAAPAMPPPEPSGDMAMLRDAHASDVARYDVLEDGQGVLTVVPDGLFAVAAEVKAM